MTSNQSANICCSIAAATFFVSVSIIFMGTTMMIVDNPLLPQPGVCKCSKPSDLPPKPAVDPKTLPEPKDSVGPLVPSPDCQKAEPESGICCKGLPKHTYEMTDAEKIQYKVK